MVRLPSLRSKVNPFRKILEKYLIFFLIDLGPLRKVFNTSFWMFRNGKLFFFRNTPFVFGKLEKTSFVEVFI